MKSLPNKFPIRYAILVTDNNKDDEEVDDFELSKRRALWSQFIDYIKVKPLELNDLSIRYAGVGYRDKYDNMLSIIPKLNAPKEWSEKTQEAIMKIIPEGLFTLYNGHAFNLTLYSYEGMFDVPIFWKILKSNKNKDLLLKELKLRQLNYYNTEGIKISMQKKYDQVMNGKTSLWENFSNLNQPAVFYIRIPYSKLWKAIDNGNEEGIVCYCDDNLDNLDDKIKKMNEPEQGFINVAIVRDLESLMLEEMVSLYKVSSFCNSCGKPLPFDYKGKYCPDTPENIDCTRKRARIRHKK